MKIKYYLPIIVMLLTVGSCKKFLDGPKPQDTLSPETYFQTADQLDDALRAVYHTLQSADLYKTKFHYLKGWEADEGYSRGSSFTVYLNSNQYSASTSDVYTYWKELYTGIGRANVLIANVDNNASIPQAYRDQIRGEALFLRGYYYFLLVQSWGGVPLVTKPVTDIENTDLARSTAKQVYDQIIADMTQAEGLVAKISTLGFGGRVSKSAVRGILARVCLADAGEPNNDVSKYAEARKWAKMVMDDAEAGHQLNPAYSDVFIKVAQNLYDIKESIWEVEFYGNGSGTYAGEAGTVGYNLGAAQTAPVPATAPNLAGTAAGFMYVNAHMYNLYAPGDTRRGWNVQNYTLSGTTGIKVLKAPPKTQADLYRLTASKWRREYEPAEAKAYTLNGENFQILRYSDVLLMFAEAENYVNGPTADALNAINLVRRRAYAIGGIKSFNITNGGTGYTTAPTVNISGNGGAAATATVAGGKVTAITLAIDPVTDYAYGKYGAAPTVTFTGGGGTGAVATTTLFTTVDADIPSGVTKAGLLSIIQDERSRELCFESLRKFDLIRWGIYVKAMQAGGDQAIADGVLNVAAINYMPSWYKNVNDNKFVYLPIPNQELVVNKLLVQNPGWN